MGWGGVGQGHTRPPVRLLLSVTTALCAHPRRREAVAEANAALDHLRRIARAEPVADGVWDTVVAATAGVQGSAFCHGDQEPFRVRVQGEGELADLVTRGLAVERGQGTAALAALGVRWSQVDATAGGIDVLVDFITHHTRRFLGSGAGATHAPVLARMLRRLADAISPGTEQAGGPILALPAALAAAAPGADAGSSPA